MMETSEKVNQLGEVLKQYRIGQNMTQLRMAEEMGVSIHTYHQWERQGKKPSVRFMIKIAEVLGVSFNDVFNMANSTR